MQTRHTQGCTQLHHGERKVTQLEGLGFTLALVRGPSGILFPPCPPWHRCEHEGITRVSTALQPPAAQGRTSPTYPSSPETGGMGLPRMAQRGGPAWPRSLGITFWHLLAKVLRRQGRGSSQCLQHVKSPSPRGFWKPEPREMGTQQENIFHSRMSPAK